jgi:malonate-semialdehyde dehydrogenase (acetylating)/methylmalonate-semialdehyde dehydrogenase
MTKGDVMNERVCHWVGEEWAGSGSRSGRVSNPATGAAIREVQFASRQDVNEVVANATRAASDWMQESLARRASVMFAFRDLLVRGRGKLARIVTEEHGKVLADAEGEISRGIDVVEFACGIPQLLKGEGSEGASRGVDVRSMRQPLGVVAGITPFNFPAMVPLWMFPIAIACGNTFVLKPSEKDPSAANWMAQRMEEAGLPPGVLNVVHGDRESVEALIAHPDVKAISFVGSTPVARSIYTQATAAGKRVQALGGAKNHMVVLPDADMEDAARAAVGAAYGSAGQRCMAVSVVVALDSIADELVKRIADHTSELVVGDGSTDGVDVGPVISAEQQQRIQALVASGLEEGATLAFDGLNKVPQSGGFFVGPCLFDHVKPTMRIYREEIFGPVLLVVRVRSFDEALELIDSNPYGNGAAVFTRDGGAASEFAKRVQAGMVGVNVAIPVPVAYHAFGGWGDSLFGDTHIYGPEGVRFYTRSKVVTSRWTVPDGNRPDLGFPTTD